MTETLARHQHVRPLLANLLVRVVVPGVLVGIPLLMLGFGAAWRAFLWLGLDDPGSGVWVLGYIVVMLVLPRAVLRAARAIGRASLRRSSGLRGALAWIDGIAPPSSSLSPRSRQVRDWITIGLLVAAVGLAVLAHPSVPLWLRNWLDPWDLRR
jgi:hypothetical protein